LPWGSGLTVSGSWSAIVTRSFTASLDAVFAGAGIEVLRSPPRAPKGNAYAERWVSTIRRECLDRMLIFNERQLVHVLTEYE
jgi:putative transposase